MSHFSELQITIANFFTVAPEKITSSTTAADISDWDSFSHMELMTKIEEHFQHKIPFQIMMDFSCVGDITNYLNDHL